MTEWEITRTHTWTCGLMYVDSEDVAGVAQMRAEIGAEAPECEACGESYPTPRVCEP